jgi:hypothetical protein
VAQKLAENSAAPSFGIGQNVALQGKEGFAQTRFAQELQGLKCSRKREWLRLRGFEVLGFCLVEHTPDT